MVITSTAHFGLRLAASNLWSDPLRLEIRLFIALRLFIATLSLISPALISSFVFHLSIPLNGTRKRAKRKFPGAGRNERQFRCGVANCGTIRILPGKVRIKEVALWCEWFPTKVATEEGK